MEGRENYRTTGIIIHDLVAVMLAIDPNLAHEDDVYEDVNLNVECEGLCKGQTVVQLNKNQIPADQPKNATVFMGIDNIAFKKAFIQLCFPDVYPMYVKHIL